MFQESFESMNMPAKPKSIEISLNSEKKVKDLENWLIPILGAEGASQCVFAINSLAEKDFVNRCDKATQEFGKELAEHFGEEDSFFDLVPHAEFSDVRSYLPPEKINTSPMKYHSLGLLEINQPGKQPMALSIDLTYGTVSNKSNQDSVLILCWPATGDSALDMLRKHYGGSWKKEFLLNKNTKKFIFNDKQS